MYIIITLSTKTQNYYKHNIQTKKDLFIKLSRDVDRTDVLGL